MVFSERRIEGRDEYIEYSDNESRRCRRIVDAMSGFAVPGLVEPAIMQQVEG